MNHLFLVGPGGAGKSSLGKYLAPLIKYPLIDLDNEFCNKYYDISKYIKHEGYSNYCIKNSQLLQKLVLESRSHNLYVLSSGFLVYEDNPNLASSNLTFIRNNGKIIRLLPSVIKEVSVSIIIKRQSQRPFYRGYDKEKVTIENRFDNYLPIGDYKIESTASPEEIASHIASILD